MKIYFVIAAAGTLLFHCPSYAAERPDIICEAAGEPSHFRAVMFSPDSRHVLTVDNVSRVWRVSDTNVVQTFSLFSGASPDAAIFTVDGTKIIATGESEIGDRTIYRLVQWRVPDGSEIWRHDRSGGSLAALPNTNLFALGTSGGIWLMPADGSSEGRRLGDTNFPGYDIRISKDGSVLAAQGASPPFYTSVVRAWAMSNETVIATWSLPSYLRSLDLSPDGTVVAIGLFGSNTRIHAVTNETSSRSLATGQTDCLRFSPDGKLLLTVSFGKLIFWRVSDGTHLQTFEDGLYEHQTQADISPDGKLFAYDRNGTLVVARMPLFILEASVRTNALHFEWQGGTAPYQLQQTTNLLGASWEDAGEPTTETTAVAPLAGTNTFFRVKSVPNP
jgi:WD40 repeat protein